MEWIAIICCSVFTETWSLKTFSSPNIRSSNSATSALPGSLVREHVQYTHSPYTLSTFNIISNTSFFFSSGSVWLLHRLCSNTVVSSSRTVSRRHTVRPPGRRLGCRMCVCRATLWRPSVAGQIWCRPAVSDQENSG